MQTITLWLVINFFLEKMRMGAILARRRQTRGYVRRRRGDEIVYVRLLDEHLIN
jgi:hypothetical protein